MPPSTAVLRAIEHEANHLRGEIGHRWFGPNWKPDGRWKVDVIGAVKGQPIPPPLPNAIRIVYWVWRDGDGAPTNAVTRLSFDGDHGYMTSAWADLCSDLTEVFDEGLPREMSHVVLGETLGKPVAWWAAQGMAADAVHQRFQFFADRQCRADLAAGRCVRLSALFELKDWPKNGEKVPAQCHSVVRFLLCRISYNMVARGAGVSAEQTFLNFVSRGREIGWDKAAKADYGFENVAAMEAAWLKWMKTKESRIDRPDPDAFRPVPAAAAPYPPLIPPVKLPSAPSVRARAPARKPKSSLALGLGWFSSGSDGLTRSRRHRPLFRFDWFVVQITRRTPLVPEAGQGDLAAALLELGRRLLQVREAGR